MELRGTPWIAAVVTAGVLMLATAISAQEQVADSNFDVRVSLPAYTSNPPTVAIDEAHRNFHTAEGRYKPLADLLTNDGYRLSRNTRTFDRDSLRDVRVLIVANALGADATADSSSSAFTDQEADYLRTWVEEGGSLLLIADHVPFGNAAESLGRRFDIQMGKGIVFDRRANTDGSPTALVFSRENTLLGSHPLLDGRSPSESIKRIVAFSGQSLSLPAGATALLKFGASAREASTSTQLEAALNGEASEVRTANGLAQAVVMKVGRGKLAVFGEAAMFTAQVVRFENGGQLEEIKMGMNVPGNDDRQFALNILHWLSGLLD
jgi:hypothetical protein